MSINKMSILLSAAILLVACGKEETAPKQEKATTEQKESAADIARKKIKASREKHKSNKNNNDEITSESATTEEVNTTEQVTTEAAVKENVNNITNRNTLSQIIYSNDYTYEEKMAAYESGVANGVIPQGTNTSSPAAAFESALQVERTGAQATAETPTTEAVDPNTGLPVQQ